MYVYIPEFEGNKLLYQSGMFFSGFESSSTIVSFTLMELARNKKCQDRAREDIRNTIELYGWSLEAFGEMKYLDQCVAEGIRLYPPVSTLDRCALNDYKVSSFSSHPLGKQALIYKMRYSLG